MAQLLIFPPAPTTQRASADATASTGDAVHDDAHDAGLDGLARLRSVVEAGEEILPQSEPVQAILQKLAAGVIECQLLSRMATLHALWPRPEKALGHGELCRQVTGVKDDEISRAGEMLGAAVVSAVHEAADVLGEAFDAEAWAGVLVEVLAPQRGPRTGEVIDIETLRLMRAGRNAVLD